MMLANLDQSMSSMFSENFVYKTKGKEVIGGMMLVLTSGLHIYLRTRACVQTLVYSYIYRARERERIRLKNYQSLRFTPKTTFQMQL